MSKIKLKIEVADALESLKSSGFSNYAIVGMLYSPRNHLDLRSIQVIDSYLGQEKMHPDDLIAAMVNGYEVIKEQTPKEKVATLLQDFYGFTVPDEILQVIESVYKKS